MLRVRTRHRRVPTINWAVVTSLVSMMAGILFECYDYFGVGKRHGGVSSVTAG